MESALEMMQVQEQLSFFTLPREIRDEIYKHIVTSTKTLELHWMLGLRTLDGSDDNRLPLLYGHTLNVQFTWEICEAFYKENTIEVDILDLVQFLSHKTHFTHLSEEPNLWPDCWRMKVRTEDFDFVPHLKTLVIHTFWTSPANELRVLLDFPSFKNIVILLSPSHFSSAAVNDLRRTFGSRLKLHENRCSWQREERGSSCDFEGGCSVPYGKVVFDGGMMSGMSKTFTMTSQNCRDCICRSFGSCHWTP